MGALGSQQWKLYVPFALIKDVVYHEIIIYAVGVWKQQKWCAHTVYETSETMNLSQLWHLNLAVTLTDAVTIRYHLPVTLMTYGTLSEATNAKHHYIFRQYLARNNFFKTVMLLECLSCWHLRKQLCFWFFLVAYFNLFVICAAGCCVPVGKTTAALQHALVPGEWQESGMTERHTLFKEVWLPNLT